MSVSRPPAKTSSSSISSPMCLELEAAGQVEPLQVVGRVEVEAQQRVVDDLHACVGVGRGAQVRGEAVRAELGLDDRGRREQQGVRARARVGRRDDHDRAAVAGGERRVGSVEQPVERRAVEQRQVRGQHQHGRCAGRDGGVAAGPQRVVQAACRDRSQSPRNSNRVRLRLSVRNQK